jgi:hypothetical protein
VDAGGTSIENTRFARWADVDMKAAITERPDAGEVA